MHFCHIPEVLVYVAEITIMNQYHLIPLTLTVTAVIFLVRVVSLARRPINAKNAIQVNLEISKKMIQINMEPAHARMVILIIIAIIQNYALHVTKLVLLAIPATGIPSA
jgi:hypothetical protein